MKSQFKTLFKGTLLVIGILTFSLHEFGLITYGSGSYLIAIREKIDERWRAYEIEEERYLREHRYDWIWSSVDNFVEKQLYGCDQEDKTGEIVSFYGYYDDFGKAYLYDYKVKKGYLLQQTSTSYDGFREIGPDQYSPSFPNLLLFGQRYNFPTETPRLTNLLELKHKLVALKDHFIDIPMERAFKLVDVFEQAPIMLIKYESVASVVVWVVQTTAKIVSSMQGSEIMIESMGEMYYTGQTPDEIDRVFAKFISQNKTTFEDISVHLSHITFANTIIDLSQVRSCFDGLSLLQSIWVCQYLNMIGLVSYSPRTCMSLMTLLTLLVYGKFPSVRKSIKDNVRSVDKWIDIARHWFVSKKQLFFEFYLNKSTGLQIIKQPNKLKWID